MSNLGRNVRIAAVDFPSGKDYDEDTFLYFLAIERARAKRTNNPLRLLFATLEPVPGKPVPIPPESATRLIEGLRRSLRETDVMGWYREGRVAGAVLTARSEAPGSAMSGAIEKRVSLGLRQRLPREAARNLRVRVMQFGPRRIETA